MQLFQLVFNYKSPNYPSLAVVVVVVVVSVEAVRHALRPPPLRIRQPTHLQLLQLKSVHILERALDQLESAHRRRHRCATTTTTATQRRNVLWEGARGRCHSAWKLGSGAMWLFAFTGKRFLYD